MVLQNNAFFKDHKDFNTNYKMAMGDKFTAFLYQ